MPCFLNEWIGGKTQLPPSFPSSLFVVVIKISSESCFTHCQYLWVWKNFFFVEAGVLLNFRILRATVLPVNWSQNRGKIFRLCKPPQK